MAGKDQYKAQDFIDAIPGSGGIITTIANRVGCDWHTAKKYITEYVTVKAAYDAEIESTVDMAESVLINNIRASRAIQNAAAQDGQYRDMIVDAADIKWFLARKGKDRDYSKRQEITGADGGPVVLVDWDHANDSD